MAVTSKRNDFIIFMFLSSIFRALLPLPLFKPSHTIMEASIDLLLYVMNSREGEALLTYRQLLGHWHQSVNCHRTSLFFFGLKLHIIEAKSRQTVCKDAQPKKRKEKGLTVSLGLKKGRFSRVMLPFRIWLPSRMGLIPISLNIILAAGQLRNRCCWGGNNKRLIHRCVGCRKDSHVSGTPGAVGSTGFVCSCCGRPDPQISQTMNSPAEQ